MNNTDLGQMASGQMITALQSMSSPSYSQPYVSVGSTTSPNTTITLPYVTGTNKYTFYTTMTSGSVFAQTYTITGLPDNFTQFYSVEVRVMGNTTTTFSTAPVFSIGYLSIEGNGGGNNDKLSCLVSTGLTAIGTSGTACAKVVFSFTKD